MIEINKDRLVKTFLELVTIPSPSWNEHEVIAYIERSVAEYGAQCERFPCGESFNLLVKLKGNRKGETGLFSCHTDTVTPCENVRPIVTEMKIMSDGTTILGGDDKAAVAVFIEVIRNLKEKNLAYADLEFLFSCAEELGLYGIKGFPLKKLNAKYAFVFDSGGDIGAIVLKAPFHLTYRVVVKGKSAHAGIEPEKGVSAIRVISEMIHAIPHGRIDRETTVNVGIVHGGLATNIVAEHAEMALEARSLSKTKLNKIDKKIVSQLKTIASRNGASVKIKKNMEYEGFALSKENRVVQIAASAIASIGVMPKFEVSGGGSDTNIINRAGIEAVNLSIGMRNVHTKKEFIKIQDLIRGAKIVHAIIERL
ncbi:MAG: M20/M25/M40 family metallo-hydrolase [Spirochaetes bacterium]|nr:M20/M25/M40 family metallo-hydrolase [Spirochaetota bacterium]